MKPVHKHAPSLPNLTDWAVMASFVVAKPKHQVTSCLLGPTQQQRVGKQSLCESPRNGPSDESRLDKSQLLLALSTHGPNWRRHFDRISAHMLMLHSVARCVVKCDGSELWRAAADRVELDARWNISWKLFANHTVNRLIRLAIKCVMTGPLPWPPEQAA